MKLFSSVLNSFRDIFSSSTLFQPFIFKGEKIDDLSKHQECCLVGFQNPGRNKITWKLTGVLIHPHVVLTAAHGVWPFKDKDFFVSLPVLSKGEVRDNNTFNVDNFIIHEKYVENETINRRPDKGNDVAILILKDSVKDIKLPRLVSNNEIISSDFEVEIVGFGVTSRTSRFNDFGVKREQKVDVTFIRLNPGEDFSEEENELRFDSKLEFIAGGAEGDTCPGDSGGPAFITISGQKKLLGLTSRNTPARCGKGTIFTRIDSKIKWIEEKLSNSGISIQL